MVTPTRGERRRARMSSAILDAAERLFSERGYRASTIEAIAQEAGVAIGSIYSHFGSKQDVYLGLVGRALETNERYLEEAYSAAGDPLDQVLAASEAYVRFHLDHPLYFRLVALRDLDPAPAAARRAVERRLEAMVRRLAAHIGAAVAEGAARPVDARRTATFLWGAWNGVLALHARGIIGDRALRETLAQGRALVLAGLRP